MSEMAYSELVLPFRTHGLPVVYVHDPERGIANRWEQVRPGWYVQRGYIPVSEEAHRHVAELKALRARIDAEFPQ